MTRVAPTLAPLMAAELDWSSATIGYLASATTVGSIAFLTMGAPFMRRLGSIRALQFGLAIGIGGLVLLMLPTWQIATIGSLLIGLGYGPSSPAGNDVLHRLAPPNHRGMIFSIKQAGVPAGGIVAGLVLPPVAELWGWRAAVIVSAVLVAAIILSVQPMRRALDAKRQMQQPLSFRVIASRRNLSEPLQALRASSSLTRLAAVGTCLAIGQGIWFAYLITFSVAALGFDLQSAGVAFAIMQGTGVFGRIVLGGMADKMRSTNRLLTIVGLASALTSLAMMFATPVWQPWQFFALSAVGGVTVSSWNGVLLSEVAKRAAHGQVREASSGATIVIFVGYVIGPTAFALLANITGRFDVGFLIAVMAALIALFITGARDQRSSTLQ